MSNQQLVSRVIKTACGSTPAILSVSVVRGGCAFGELLCALGKLGCFVNFRGYFGLLV